MFDTESSQADTAERSSEAPQTPEEQQAIKENIPEDIQAALLDLIRMGERESDLARRGHYKRMLEAEEFWKGNHYPIWSEKDFSFRTPWDYALEKGRLEDQPVYQYIINVFQAYGLTIIAALSQRVPKVRFFPRSAKSEIDIATARASSDIAELVEKNNRIKIIAMREAYLLWTQGGFGTFTRFVRDKRQGIEEEIPVMEMSTVTVAPDRYACKSCGEEISSEEIQSQPTVDELGHESDLKTCPSCGYALTDSDFMPAESAEVPVVSDIKKIPEGFEKMTVYGFLNLKMSPYAHGFDGTGYLHLVEDVHEAAVRAAHPALHREIGANADSGTSGSQGSITDTYERTGRMKLFDASSPYSGLRAIPATSYVTYKRCWLRAWFLMGHPDPDMRERLMQMFPTGVYVALAGDKFLDAREEDIDDFWTICTAMPGYGLYTEAIGGSTIPMNKQINDASNVIAEHIDYGTAPPVFTDAEFVNMEALRQTKMRPGNFFPITRTRGGMARNISDLMYQPQIKIDANIYGYGRNLIELAQVVNGALPSLFGGQMKGNETAAAYAQSRDQAMGKLQLFWANVKQHHADTMRIAVECFRRNRTKDTEKVVIGKGDDYTSKYIHLENLKGNILAEPEADEDFPATWAEIRSNLQEMLTSSPEMAQIILSEPANAPVLRKFLASPAIILPSEDNREKQFREIDELLMAAPVPTLDPNPMAMDPMTGGPGTKWLPTVMPDVHADDHVVHIKAIQEWVVSDDGIMAKKSNPEGYANALAHLLAHKEAIAQVQAFDQQLIMQYGLMPAAPEDGAPGGGEPKSDSKQPPPKQ